VGPAEYIPYCGTAPVPGDLAWNYASLLVVALIGGAWTTWVSGPRWRTAAGWLVVALALGSPLCHLSVALFSARVTQHMILVLLAAPLIAIGVRGRAGVIWPAVGFALALWMWHLPGPYDAAFRSDAAYWLMHLSILATAIWLWRGLLSAPASRAFLASLLTALQMSLLGAVLTFAPRALFQVHATTTAAWGLSPLEDQQLGGLIMWVPAGVLFSLFVIAAAGWHLWRMELRHGPTLRHGA
jgi:putative membrane protein